MCTRSFVTIRCVLTKPYRHFSKRVTTRRTTRRTTVVALRDPSGSKSCKFKVLKQRQRIRNCSVVILFHLVKLQRYQVTRRPIGLFLLETQIQSIAHVGHAIEKYAKQQFSECLSILTASHKNTQSFVIIMANVDDFNNYFTAAF